MKQIIVLALAVAYANSDCLSASVLTSLGFSSTQAVAIETSPTVCTDLFKQYGTCVPDADVEAKLKADNASLSASFNVFVDIYASIADLNSTLLKAAGQTSAQISTANASVKAEPGACITAWSTLQQGITCYLASGDASSNTTAGSTVTVTISSATAGPLIAACLPVLETVCEFQTDTSFDNSTSLTVNNFKTDTNVSSNSNLTAACATLAANSNCTTSTCTQAQYDVLIDTFFSPYDYSTFPSATVATSISSSIDAANTQLAAAVKADASTLSTLIAGLDVNASGSASTSDSTSTDASASGSTSAATNAATTAATNATNASTSTNANSSTSTGSNTSSRRLASTTAVKAQSSSTSGTDAAAHGNNSGVVKASSSGAFIYALTSLIVAFIAAFTI